MESGYVLKSLRNGSNKNQYKRMVLFILINLTIIQQMPFIKDQFYSQIRLILYVGFALSSAISFLRINKFSKVNFVRYFIFTITYSFVLVFIVKIFVGDSTEMFELIIPFGVLICSLNTNYNKRQLSNLLIWYVILSLILGTSSIFYYGQGFTITRNYFLVGKNQIGPLLGISAVISGIWILNKKQFDVKYDNLIFKMAIFVLLIASIIVIRNRSGLLGIFITAILALPKEYKFRFTIKNILILQVVLLVFVLSYFLGLFDGIIDAIFKSLFFNYDISDINSISAGRTNVYTTSLKFIRRHPILGELGTGKAIFSIPHNYIINKWVKYGVFGSLPLILFYLYLWFFSFKEIKVKCKKTNYALLPIWVLLFSLIVSMFEYTYPYGPGVSQLMVWFLLGQYFRNNSNLFV